MSLRSEEDSKGGDGRIKCNKFYARQKHMPGTPCEDSAHWQVPPASSPGFGHFGSRPKKEESVPVNRYVCKLSTVRRKKQTNIVQAGRHCGMLHGARLGYGIFHLLLPRASAKQNPYLAMDVDRRTSVAAG